MACKDIDFDEQYHRMEMDIAWDAYVDECRAIGIPTMSFAEWKQYYISKS